jgi:quercetin dioxygenase-like cupin family protein
MFTPTDWVPLGTGGRRRIVADGARVMIMEAEFAQAGGGIGTHQHMHEQVTTIVRGSLELIVGGVRHVLCPGDFVVIPGDVPHSATALEDGTLARDTFSPPREDFR